MGFGQKHWLNQVITVIEEKILWNRLGL